MDLQCALSLTIPERSEYIMRLQKRPANQIRFHSDFLTLYNLVFLDRSKGISIVYRRLLCKLCVVQTIGLNIGCGKQTYSYRVTVSFYSRFLKSIILYFWKQISSFGQVLPTLKKRRVQFSTLITVVNAGNNLHFQFEVQSLPDFSAA